MPETDIKTTQAESPGRKGAFTIPCSKCGKTFTKPTARRAAQALRMHTDRVHSKRIKTPTKKIKLASLRARQYRANRKARLAMTNAAPIGTDQPLRFNKNGTPRKPWTRRKVAPKLLPELRQGWNEPGTTINFCPECGCNIKHWAEGYAIRKSV